VEKISWFQSLSQDNDFWNIREGLYLYSTAVLFLEIVNLLGLILELISTGMYSLYIIGCQWEGFADGWPSPVNLAALAFGIECEATFAAFAASCTFSAPFSSPLSHLVPF
jgi:hypothetical protein